jgi:magnesium transporter
MVSGEAQPEPPDSRASPGGFRLPCLTSVDVDRIEEHLARDEFFWLDLTDPSEAEVDRLGEVFKFHPLALEDTGHFDQRPKLDDYQDYVFLVFYGAGERRAEKSAPLREVHLFISGRFLVTVHREDIPVLEEERARLVGHAVHSEEFVLYRVFDALTDTFFPLLAEMDNEIDSLEDAIIGSPTDEQLQRLFVLKRQLVALRRVVSPQRDIFARSIDQLAQLPGLTLDKRDYFRDVYDHLIRISDLIDSYRDLLSSATDLYLSTVSNRQNDVMKQLAIVGTIFLPLSFITGFFGMNFGWLVAHGIRAEWTFWLLGIGSMTATCIALLAFFKRKGWV